MMEQENFQHIFVAALSKWPQNLSLAELRSGEGERYSVLGLVGQLEKIEDDYIGGENEIIWRELHWSIFSVIHSVAKNLLEINTSSIRAEAVKTVFERRLQKAISAKDPAWDAEDFVLAQSYLREDVS